MSKIGVEVLGDKTVFKIQEQTSYGVPDTNRDVVVSDNLTDALPRFPYVAPTNYISTILFWNNKRQQWIAFNFISFQEKSFGPYEHEYLGPYLYDLAKKPENKDQDQEPLEILVYKNGTFDAELLFPDAVKSVTLYLSEREETDGAERCLDLSIGLSQLPGWNLRKTREVKIAELIVRGIVSNEDVFGLFGIEGLHPSPGLPKGPYYAVDTVLLNMLNEFQQYQQ